MTRGEAKTIVKKNLESLGSVFYNDSELNDSCQDAYDDIASRTQCIMKSTTLNQAAKNYYNFKDDHAITDYLATVAIFNNLTNLWLRDDVSYRQFDRIRQDWENWRGSSQFWAPLAYNRIVIAPFNTTATSTFLLRYAALAPTLASDLTAFLISSHRSTLVTNYMTADMLETAEEYNKAQFYWNEYDSEVEAYKEQCHNIAKSDLLLRV